MAMVSISEAAKLAGISRTHFYRKYINSGTISISKDKVGKPLIETSELLRVFGMLQKEHERVTEGDMQKTSKNDMSESTFLEKIKGLETLLEAKERELESYREREKILYRLLEHKPRKKRWWIFGL